MRTHPSVTYSGLTIILDEASRFDKEFNHLLSGPARDYLNNECLPAHYHLDSCDIRDLDCRDPLLDNTKAIILAGEQASEKLGHCKNDPPGYSTIAMGRPALPIFYPQDCCDYKNLRGSYEDNEEAMTDRDTKESIPTLRKNWRFWNTWHIKKFLMGETPKYPKIIFKIFPPLEEAIKILNTTNNENIYLDIETSRLHRCLSCVGFTTDRSFPSVFVIPYYLTNGSIACSDSYKFHRELSLALSRNQVVIHNSMFDLIVLHGFYKMCLPLSVYDTMVAQHRIFLEAEKSLAHSISCWTNMPNHKNFSTEVYNREGEEKLWEYNAYDVYCLKLIKDAQLAYGNLDAGLSASIAQGNDSILPYLVTSLTGMPMDLLSLSHTHGILERRKQVFARVASILTGTSFNPASSKQCGDFFHNKLNYPVVSRTATGAPALGSKQLYQMQLKHNNPLIPVILKYREVAKDASSLESELFTIP